MVNALHPRERRRRSSGRRHSDAKIVVHRPVWPYVVIFICIVLIFLGSWIGYQYGHSRYEHLPVQDIMDERKFLVRKNKGLLKKVDDLNAKVSNLEKALEVNEHARSRLQQEFKQYYDKLAALESEITYYKRVLKPGLDDKGIVLGVLEIKKLSKERTFRIELDVLQVNSMKKVKGRIEFIVGGHLNERKESFTFGELLATEQSSFKLSFKNYQTVRSEVELPDGFSPDQLSVNAHFVSGKKLKVSRIYDWILQES